MDSLIKPKVFTRRIHGWMWALGMPTHDARYADIIRAALRAGLDEKQACHLAKLAFSAAEGYTWQLPEGSHIQRATKERNAAEHPNGRDAEELAAEREGRLSRWGTPEFHQVAS